MIVTPCPHSTNTSEVVEVLALNGESGNYWFKQTVASKLLAQSEAFQVIIEGQLGNGTLADIAVDDFVFSPGCK